jgi:ribosomal protein L34E
MRPAMRRAKKKKVKTPGGKFAYHRLGKSPKASCSVCHEPLQGSRRARAHPNLCAPCSKKMMQEKVKFYAEKK